jgi:hypothetical protein
MQPGPVGCVHRCDQPRTIRLITKWDMQWETPPEKRPPIRFHLVGAAAFPGQLAPILR